MNITLYKDRSYKKDYLENEGTSNENRATLLSFKFPEGFENYAKRIVFITPEGNYEDLIVNDTYTLTNAITKFESVDVYVKLTFENVDWRSKTFPLTFNENEEFDSEIPEEKIDELATILDQVNKTIDRIKEIEISIEDLEHLTGRVDVIEEKVENFNGRFDELDGKIDEVKELAENNTTEINNTNQELNNVKIELNSLDTEVERLTDNVNNIAADVNKIDTKVDSIAADVETNKTEIRELEENQNYLEENKADKSEIPDVSQFITKAVNDLVNYYKKSETYTQSEVNELIGRIKTISMKVLPTRPEVGESNIIYLIPSTKTEPENIYDEWIYVDNKWERIGSTQIDLSNYYNKEEINTILYDYITSNDLEEILADYVKTEVLKDYVKNDKFDTLAEKVAEIELFKFPNVIIHGEPTINNGQVSNFSTENYLSFPSIFNLHDRGFEFNFAFRTGSDVNTAQNILGSNFCIALYIQNSKIRLRVSSNGTSWDLVDIEGNLDIQPNTNYYIQIYFDKLTYKLKYSLDGIEYTDIASKVASVSPFAKQIYLGIGNNFHNPFLGMINLNKCNLKVNKSVIWQGMDDAGLATRLATDLENIDEAGIERINEIVGESGIVELVENKSQGIDDSEEKYPSNKAVNSELKVLKEIIENLPQTEELEGREITLNNTSVGYLYHGEEQGIGIEGDIEQETREGYNLLPLNSYDGITWAGNLIDNQKALNLLSAGNYRVKIKFKLTSKMDKFSSNDQYGIFLYNSVVSPLNRRENWNAETIGTIREINEQITITEEMVGKFTNFYVYGCGNNSVGVTGSATVFDMQLSEGTEDKPYEPYGASPSPEFPSEVNSVDGNYDVKVENNIKVDTSKVLDVINDAGNIRKGFYSRLLKSGTYTVFFDENNSSPYYVGKTIDKNSKPTYIGFSSISKKYTFTLTQDSYLVFWYLGATPNDTMIIVKGNVETLPLYKEQLLPLDLRNRTETETPYQYELFKGSKIIRNGFEDYSIYSEWKKVVLNGTEEYGNLADFKRFSIMINDIDRTPFGASEVDTKIICNKLKAIDNQSAFNGVMGIHRRTTGTGQIIINNVKETPFSSINEFKQWVAQNPLTVYYYLATPTTKKITSEILNKQLENICKSLSYKEQTNISVTGNDLLPILKAKGLLDIASIIKNLDDRLSLLE